MEGAEGEREAEGGKVFAAQAKNKEVTRKQHDSSKDCGACTPQTRSWVPLP